MILKFKKKMELSAINSNLNNVQNKKNKKSSISLEVQSPHKGPNLLKDHISIKVKSLLV